MTELSQLRAFSFAEGFVWGNAVAGHQVEGNNINAQFYRMEEERGTPHRSGQACNHFDLYPQDIALMGELGHQAFRFSLEWSRIEPREGEFDSSAIAHYLDVAQRTKEAGMQVVLTLHHFTHPQWFEEKGQFSRLENLVVFERFAAQVAPLFAPYVDAWIVLNEMNLGMFHPTDLQARLNAIRFHARGFHVLRSHSKAPISSAHALVHYSPRRPYDELDALMTRQRDFCDNEFFFHAIRTGEILYPNHDGEVVLEVKDSLDFWAVQYYTRQMVDGRRADARGARYMHNHRQMIPMPGFYLEEFYPDGLHASLLRLRDKPIWITENGLAADDDRLRIAYLALHLAAIHDAIQDGCDVRAYLHWTLLDNFEWGSYTPRFGLVDVNHNTFERTPKPSAYFFREVIEANGFAPEMLSRYLAPENGVSL